MKVKLISMTKSPIDLMWIAARTCYSEKSPIEMWDETRDEPKDEFKQEIEDKRWNLVKKVIDSKHLSILEHVNLTFCIEGVSRSLLAQFTRHRAGIVFSVQSQRYVEFKESYSAVLESFDSGSSQSEDYLKFVADKYFVDVTTDNYRDYIRALIDYLGALKRGIKAEDARMILPNATKTNITVTMNLRELIHIAGLRLCSAAQLEIRQLLKAMKEEVARYDKRLGDLLQPQCESLGYCPDFRSCGRKPKMEEVLDGYYKYEGLQ